MQVIHPLAPVYDIGSRVLILGTMPSPRSRDQGFYYGHPQNRFWKILCTLYDEPFAQNIPQRLDLLHRHHIALWDVLAQCEISGAKDSSIRDPVANDISSILKQCNIRAIYTTGQTAAKWYKRLIQPYTDIEAITLPSTSPANCAVSMEELLDTYAQILQYTGK